MFVERIPLLDDRAEAVVIQSLQNYLTIIDEVGNDTINPNTFIALQRMSEKVHFAAMALNDIANQHNISISFVPNPIITKFLSSGTVLGEIKKDTIRSNDLTFFPEMNFLSHFSTKPESKILKANKRMHLLFLLAYFVVYLRLLLQHIQ